MADSILVPTAASFSNASMLLTAGGVQETIKSVLRDFSAASIEFGDVFSGIFKGIDNTRKAILPARAVSVQFNKILRKTPRDVIDNGLEGFEQFTRALGSLMRQLHSFEQPEIVRVTPKMESLLDKLVANEEVHKFPKSRVALRKDLKTRLTHPRRMIMAWMDPFEPGCALISVQLAFTSGKGKNFEDIVHAKDKVTGDIDTVTPYSVTNLGVMDGLGPSFMYAVRKAVLAEHPVRQMTTLSPTEGFAKHVLAMPEGARPRDDEGWLRLGYEYTLGMKQTDHGYQLRDFVANQHMGANGAVFDGMTLDANPARKEIRGPAAHYTYPSREEGEANARALRKEGQVTYTGEVARFYRPAGTYPDGQIDFAQPA